MSLQSFVIFVIFLLTTENIKPTVCHLEDDNNIGLWRNTSHNSEFEDQLDIKIPYEIKSIIDSLEEVKLKINNYLSKKKPKPLDWWQTSVIYQIYPRSFKDSSGNGIGDIQGIIEKIPYIKDLGVNAIWLNPIYPSPGDDLGYDITDFKNIDELFGSMIDFDRLLKECHKNGIKVILDFVPNHTSDKHKWFVKSVQNIIPYKDYYVWADAKYVNGTKQVPNNWTTVSGRSSAWQWNEPRQQYYLHQFDDIKMPDLNYRCPLVRDEMESVLRFWLDRGVDGFRVGAVDHIYEQKNLTDAPPEPVNGRPRKLGYMTCLDETYRIVESWRSVLDGYNRTDNQTRLMFVETHSPPEYAMKYYGNVTNPGAHFTLNDNMFHLDHKPAKMFVDTLSDWLNLLPPDAWSSWTIGNHDSFPRAAARFGDELLDGIHMTQLLLPGTPVVYMADELGMTSTVLRPDQYVTEPGPHDQRVLSRSPFQWDSTPQAGFSRNHKPWLPVNPNYVTLNAKDQSAADRSHLTVFNKLVQLRRSEVFRSGDVRFHEVSEYVFAFSRSNYLFESYFVVINLGTEMETIDLTKIKRLLPHTMKVVVASVNAEQQNGDIINTNRLTLRPNSALVLESNLFKGIGCTKA